MSSHVTKVYQALSTDAGRANFWAETAVKQDGIIHFVFPNGMTWDGVIVEAVPQRLYAIRYFGNSLATFHLTPDGQGGTDLTVTDEGVPPVDRMEVVAGWVSVLMNLKAFVDYGVDLRTHDLSRHWNHGYVEN